MKNLSSFGYERIVGKTICKGKYSDIYYYRGIHEACTKEDATHCIIFEKNKKGQTINRIYCKL